MRVVVVSENGWTANGWTANGWTATLSYVSPLADFIARLLAEICPPSPSIAANNRGARRHPPHGPPLLSISKSDLPSFDDGFPRQLSSPCRRCSSQKKSSALSIRARRLYGQQRSSARRRRLLSLSGLVKPGSMHSLIEPRPASSDPRSNS